MSRTSAIRTGMPLPWPAARYVVPTRPDLCTAWLSMTKPTA